MERKPQPDSSQPDASQPDASQPDASQPDSSQSSTQSRDPRSGDSRGDATRESLIQAGIELFSKQGFHAASSRALAEAAGVNQALIGYHFGGKRGLYLAVFEFIGENISARLGPAAEESRHLLVQIERGDAQREALIAAVLAIVDRAINLFTSPETERWAMLIVREQQNPSEAFDLVWNRFMSPFGGLLRRLVGALRDRPVEDEEVGLLALTIIGQPLFFRVARETALRLMGWTKIGDAERAAIRRRIHQNVLAMLIEEDPR